MARDEAPPFERGQTFHGGDATAITNGLTETAHLEGMEWVFEDLDYSVQGAKPKRSGKAVRCRCVRNTGAVALLPKQLVTPEVDAASGKDLLGRVDGKVRLTAARCFPVDEWLPAAGVAVNDLFWIVVEGPATIQTPLAGDASNVIAVGDRLVSVTAATSGATTAGRATVQDLTGATALLGNQVQNRIGFALSAKTTANTNADLLIDVTKL